MNLSGTALYEGCVVLFVAQVYGVPLTVGSQLTLLVLAVLSAVAVAGIPGGSLPLIVALLAAHALSAPKIPTWTVVAISVALMTIACLAAQLNWGQAREHWGQVQETIVVAALLLSVAVVLLILRERFPKSRSVTDWGLIVLVFVDLYLYGSHFNPTGPIAKLMPVTPGIQYLRTNSGTDRILTYQRDDNILSLLTLDATEPAFQPGATDAVEVDGERGVQRSGVRVGFGFP